MTSELEKRIKEAEELILKNNHSNKLNNLIRSSEIDLFAIIDFYLSNNNLEYAIPIIEKIKHKNLQKIYYNKLARTAQRYAIGNQHEYYHDLAKEYAPKGKLD